jgi:type III secretion protein R
MGGANHDVVSFSLLLGFLALIPLVVVTTTSFLKISMVLMTLRNAIGVQQVPPTMAIYGIALAVSIFVMAPTLQQVGDRVSKIDPTMNDSRTESLFGHAKDVFQPVQQFMLKYAHPDQREVFLASAKKLWPKEMSKDATSSDPVILIPAFVVSELQAGFEIGFLIYLPFVIIDLLVANLLMALGMQQVSPQTITIPLKLLLFVLIDGWGKVLTGLVNTYI